MTYDERTTREPDTGLGDTGFEHETGLGFAASGGGRRPRRRRSGPNAFVRFLLFLVVLAVLGGAVLAVGLVIRGHLPSLGGPSDYAGDGTGRVLVHVSPGDTAADIARTLVADDVVKSIGAFTGPASNDPRSKGIQPGYYDMHHHMSGSAALALMLDPASRVHTSVTIPEGSTDAEALARLAGIGRITAAQLKAASAHPSRLGVPSWGRGKLEGFLFPDTYQIDPGSTARQVLTTMVSQFRDVADSVDLTAGAARLHHSSYDVLRIASICEKEAGLQADFSKVARVIYNRLAIGMPLQLDSTLEYVLPVRKGHLLDKDLENPSPYNTYRHTGLPPTPIDNPGKQALLAALHPATGNWLYFVTIDKAGHTGFASTYSQFLQLRQEAERNGVIS